MIEIKLTPTHIQMITSGSSALRKEVREWLDKNCGQMMTKPSSGLVKTNNSFSGWCYVYRMPNTVRTNSGHRTMENGGTFMQFIRPKHAMMFKMRWL